MDHWLQNRAFQVDVLDEFLADVLVEELSTVAAVSMQEGKYKVMLPDELTILIYWNAVGS